jgi:phosphoribosyl 1,2-cyclic phosphodiesterase
MRVTFWGTRGSLPVAHGSAAIQGKLKAALKAAEGRPFGDEEALERFIREELAFPVSHSYGGNTSCVELDTGGDEYLVCDLGSGARELGNRVLAEHGPGNPRTFHVLMSHLHWDHIMGFPFFPPAYIPGNTVHIYGCHEALEQAFRAQHGAPGFPVPFDALGAEIRFHHLEPGADYAIAGCRVRPRLQHHGGDSYGYRVACGGTTVVYSTDSEHKLEDEAETRGFVEFFRDADLVIFDAMYSLAEAMSVKEDWGHSSNLVGVELCQRAGARHLCLFHHEPAHDDETIHRVLLETRRYEELSRGDTPLTVTSAYDGLVIAL